MESHLMKLGRLSVFGNSAGCGWPTRPAMPSAGPRSSPQAFAGARSELRPIRLPGPVPAAHPRGAKGPSGRGDRREVDFGLAYRPGKRQGPSRPGSFSGTPAYVASEQARGDDFDPHPSNDQYSLGGGALRNALWPDTVLRPSTFLANCCRRSRASPAEGVGLPACPRA